MCKIQLPFELEICNVFELMFVGYHCCMASSCRQNHTVECRMTTQANGSTFAKQSFTHSTTNGMIELKFLVEIRAEN